MTADSPRVAARSGMATAMMMTLVILGLCQTAQAAGQYFFYHLGVAGTVSGVTQPVVISSVPLSGSIGTVLGYDYNYGGSFGWVGGTMPGRPPYFPNEWAVPSGISHNGAVAALSFPTNYSICYTIGDVTQRGFWVTPSCNALNPSLISAILFGINDSGLVVGEGVRVVWTRNGPVTVTSAFRAQCTSLLPCGSPVFLPTFGGTYGSARAINNVNQIVGESTNSLGMTRAFSISIPGSTLVDFEPTDLSYNSSANAVNDRGVAAGSVNPGPCPQRLLSFAYCDKRDLLYRLPVSFSGKGKFALLGSLGSKQGVGVEGVALSINNAGDIVGWGTDAKGARHAFLYSGGSMTDLNTALLSGGSGWVLREANGINDWGQIVGHATGPSGQNEIFVLDPIPN